MRQVFLDKGLVKIKKVCEPLLDDNTVLISVHYSCVCPGVEASITSQVRRNILKDIPAKLPKVLVSIAKNGFEGTRALIREKLAGNLQALGYSCSGQVIAVGKNVKRLRAGDFVACAGAGYAHHADVVAVPENLVARVSKQEYLADASMTTLGAMALQGLRRAQMQLGETVCVMGLGLVGQLTVQLAVRSGFRVIGVDLIPERLELARELGAQVVLHGVEQDIQKEVELVTDHHGVDCTIITAESKDENVLQQSMQATREKGRIVIVGEVGMTFKQTPLNEKEIDFLVSSSYGPGHHDSSYEQQGIDYPYPFVRWTENRNMQAFVELIEREQIDIKKLITKSISIDEAQQAYDEYKNPQTLSVVLAYGEDKPVRALPRNEQSKKEQIQFIPAVKDAIRVGFVGAGDFAKMKLMPLVSRIKNVKINAVVDANMANLATVSKLYGAAKALADDSQLFDEDVIDAVVIASPHKYHAAQSLTALQNGKAVFVEKPMVTDFDQLNEIRKFFNDHSEIPFCVDYSRSFAPFIQKIKKELNKRHSPLVIQYRMNAGFIPKDHWIQTEVGAGRIIGEACHIFDLFCFLTDAKPRSVSVEALRSSSDNLFPTDNFSAQISFSDGSICNLVYTSLGHEGLSKERMEVFYDSKAILMDDYKVLQGFGLPSSFNEQTMRTDKGHKQLLNEFFNGIKKENYSSPISLKRLDMVAELTLIIDQLACAGGGEREIGT